MTIEQYITPFLSEQLEKALPDYKVLVVNDITHADFTDDKSVIFNIKTGQSQLSAIKGTTEITTPTQINFKCFTNEQQEILSKLTDLVYKLNTTTFDTNDMKYKVELLLNTPTLILTQYETFEDETKLVSYGVFVITSYATDNNLVRYDKFIQIGNSYYELGSNQQVIENVAYNYANSPTESDLGEEKYQDKAINITITMAKTYGGLSSYLEEHKLNLENQVFKYLKVLPDKEPTVVENIAYSLDTIVTQVTETEQSGIPVITLVLKGIA